MLSIENIKYSLKNLFARKSRSLLTILSIFIGIATIFIFISFGMGLYNYVNEIATESGVDKFIVQVRSTGAPGLDPTFILGEKDVDGINRVKGVGAIAPFYAASVEVEKDDQRKFVFGMATIDGTEQLRLLKELMTVDVLKGRELKKGDSGKLVVGYNYQVPYKIFERPVKVGDKLSVNDVKFEVIGIMESIGNPGDDANVYLSEDDFIKLFPEKESKYGFIFGSVSNIEEIDLIVDNVEKELRKVRDLEEGKEDFFVQTYEEAIEMFSSALNIVIGFIILIALISVVVSAINTANTMATSVLERTREIGIMKSIGATNSTIRNIFLFESSFLGFVAGIIGVLIGWGISSYMAGVLDGLGWGFLTPIFPSSLFVGLILFATGVGTVSGVTVAIQAAKLNAVDSLRYE